MAKYFLFKKLPTFFLLSILALSLKASGLENTVTKLEDTLQASIGMVADDSESGNLFACKEHERFPLTSAFKPLACTALLHQVDSGKISLRQTVMADKNKLVDYSPVTQKYVGQTITLEKLCEVAVSMSDNTAVAVSYMSNTNASMQERNDAMAAIGKSDYGYHQF